MGDPYAYGKQSKETAQLQVKLNDKGIDAGIPDGWFGPQTREGVKTVQRMLGVVVTGQPDQAVLVYLGLAPASSPSIFDQIGTIMSVISILKGKTMTADQITGVIRALIAGLSGILIAKGWGTADFWTWVSAGVTAIIPVVWSWISNRPKTIVPIASK